MPVKDYLKLYSKTPIGIGSMFAGAGLGAVLVFAGLPVALCAAFAALFVGGAGAVALISGAGPRQAAAAREASLARGRSVKLAAAGKAREKLSRMRLADQDIANAAQLVVLAAGEYLEACAHESADDPVADAAIGEAVELVELFLREKNEDATEKRFGLEDSDPFVGAKERIRAALEEKALVLRERRIQIDGGLAAVGKMAVREELE